MTDVEKISVLSNLTGETDETILSLYLSIAGEAIISRAYPYTTVDEVPSQYDYKQCTIAAYLYNKQGAEGQTSHSENGISRVYESADIPESMLRNIVPHVGVFE